jgi:hypothetical protein
MKVMCKVRMLSIKLISFFLLRDDDVFYVSDGKPFIGKLFKVFVAYMYAALN